MQNILLIISVIVTLLSLALLTYKINKTSTQKEGFDLETRKYYPYLYAMTTDEEGQLYTDKGMTYMQRYDMCSENPDLWPCKLMFQEGL